MEKIIQDGKYLLSGVGTAQINTTGWDEETTHEVHLFCLNGITYGAWIDPDDGYRSYGDFRKMEENVKCQYRFPPQEVIVTNVTKKGPCGDSLYYEDNSTTIVITDATNGKEVLVIGTSYYDSYYPMAIFRYTPENLEINQNR